MHHLLGSAALAVAAVFFLIWLEHKVMKLLIFLSLMAAAVWFVASKTGKTQLLLQAGKQAENYASGLKTDAQRAQAARSIANKIIGQENQIQSSLREATQQVQKINNP